MDTSLGTICIICGAFFQFTNVQPSFPLLTHPPSQTALDAHVHNFFRVSTLYRVGERELRESFAKDALF